MSKGANADGGYSHWHELGRKKPPGNSIPERKAPDSGPEGLGSKAGGDRPVKNSPKLPSGPSIGKQVKPIGS